ncbi:MAG: hypothetical protein QXK63_06205, partial [Thermoproteus sp.]
MWTLTAVKYSKDVDNWVGGFVLGFNGPNLAPNIYEAVEDLRFYNPVDALLDGKDFDDVAIAIYLKMLGAMVLAPRSYPGTMTNDATLELLIPYMDFGLEALKVRDKANLLQRAVKEGVEALVNNADKVKPIDVGDNRQAFIKRLEEVESTGGSMFVWYRKVPYYITTVKFWPSYVFLNIYGFTPRVEGRLGVAIPFTWHYTDETFPPMEEINDIKYEDLIGGAKPNIVLRTLSNFSYGPGVWPPFNIPLFFKRGGGELLLEKGKYQAEAWLRYPLIYAVMAKDHIPIITAFSYDCPVMLKARLVKQYADEVSKLVKNYPPEFLEPADALVQACKDVKVLGISTPAFVMTYYMHPLINLPLINALTWLKIRYGSSKVSATLDFIAENFSRINWDEYAREHNLAPMLRTLMQRTAAVIPLSGYTVDSTLSPSRHRFYAAVGFHPVMRAGERFDPKNSNHQRNFFTWFVHPVVFTFSKDNVHPGGLLFAYKEEGRYVPMHEVTFDEMDKLARYLYFTDGNKDPPDLESLGFDFAEA